MVRRKLTAADFPQEFMSIWQLAVERKLLLQMDSAGQARNFIQRLYVFRKRLLEEAPQIATPFYAVDLRIHDEAGNVITGKATAVVGKALIKDHVSTWKAQVAGLIAVSEIEVSASKDSALEHVVSIPAPEADSLSETLNTLGFGTGEKP
jgi:hypothetical protein